MHMGGGGAQAAVGGGGAQAAVGGGAWRQAGGGGGCAFEVSSGSREEAEERILVFVYVHMGGMRI